MPLATDTPPISEPERPIDPAEEPSWPAPEPDRPVDPAEAPGGPVPDDERLVPSEPDEP